MPLGQGPDSSKAGWPDSIQLQCFLRTLASNPCRSGALDLTYWTELPQPGVPRDNMSDANDSHAHGILSIPPPQQHPTYMSLNRHELRYHGEPRTILAYYCW